LIWPPVDDHAPPSGPVSRLTGAALFVPTDFHFVWRASCEERRRRSNPVCSGFGS